MRRLLSLGVALAVLAAGGAAAQAAPTPGWEHMGYDAEGSYFNPREKQINPGTIGNLTRQWKTTLRVNHDEYCGRGHGQPIVAGGRVIAPDQLGISAVAADNGHSVWQFTWPDPSDAGLPLIAVYGSVVIAAMASCQSASAPSGDIVGLDLETGHIRWRNHSSVPFYSLAVDKGVAVVSGSSPSADQTAIAYRATDGHPLWTKPGYDSSGVCANGILLVTGASQTSAVSITTGAVRWSKSGTWRAHSATPASDRFLATSGTTLAAINVNDGSVAWTARGLAADLIATDGQRVYLSADRTVTALTARTGRRTWSHTLPVQAQQPVVAGGLVYTSSHILSASRGTMASMGFPGQDTVIAAHVYALDGQTLTAYMP